MKKLKNWSWIEYPQTGSTNDEAKDYSAGKRTLNFVITAQKQTGGRGRRGRSWIGMEGNLFASMGFPADISCVGQLVVLISLSVAETICQLSKMPKVSLKWPNDVLVNNRKISGILLEKGEGDYIIAGFGVNIVSSPDAAEMLYPCTSLREAGIEIDRIDFLRRCLGTFNKNYKIWQKYGFADIKERWLKMADTLGEEIQVNGEKGIKKGRFIGIDDCGLLLLQNGRNIEKIYAGDIFPAA